MAAFGGLRINPPNSRFSESTMRMRFFIFSDNFEEKTQYVIYDLNSLIADIGGYLGLLLGHSIYSIIYRVVKSFT